MNNLLPKARADVIRDAFGPVVAGLVSVTIFYVTGVWVWCAFGG